MDASTLNTKTLLGLVTLTRRKEQLEEELKSIDSQIVATLEGGTATTTSRKQTKPAAAAKARSATPAAAPASSSAASAAEPPRRRRGRRAARRRGASTPGRKPKGYVKTSASKAPASKAGGGTSKRGALKDSIIRLLKSAGPKGLAAKEISDKLNIPNQNVHVWFSSTGKKVPGLTKSKDKRWSMKG